MSINVTTHLNFRGEARAALEFYRSVFGGTLEVATYADMGIVRDPADADLVIWGQVAAPSGFRIMAFDAGAQLPFDPGRNAFYVVLRFGSDEEIRACWETLGSGGSVRHELAPAPWGASLYGMLQDKFGVVWVLSVDAAVPAS